MYLIIILYNIIDDVVGKATATIVITVGGVAIAAIQASGMTAIIIAGGVAVGAVLVGGAIAYTIYRKTEKGY